MSIIQLPLLLFLCLPNQRFRVPERRLALAIVTLCVDFSHYKYVNEASTLCIPHANTPNTLASVSLQTTTMSFPRSLLLGLLFAGSALAQLQVLAPVAELNIVNKDISPDGYSRSAVLVNGVYPAPLITAMKGDDFLLNVEDKLTDNSMDTATTIHWHGLFQQGTTYADGVAYVSQCPIIPNNNFLYQFSSTDQAGTFWYHSHLSTQYCDGLRGPLVIYDPTDPQHYLYDIDDASTVITLSDWYHTPAPSAGFFPAPDSTLINGLGRFQGGPASPLSVTTVATGLRYRLRLVALSCHSNWVFSIDSHNFTIIEADGVSTQPLTVDSLQILPAQRYSIVLHANQKIGNYWIRALPDISTGNLTTSGGLNSGILRYLGAPIADPTSTQTPSTNPLVETNLHTLTNPGAPGLPEAGGADVTIQLDLAFAFASKPYFTVNNYTYTSPSVPVLLQILSGAQNAQDLLPAGSVYTLPKNKTIEVIFNPGVLPGAPHPFHLHGHTFDVVRSAGSTTYNYVNPVRRDVVNIGGESGDDQVTIRFRTDNPGPWFLHCHIDWHLAIGLAIVFAEEPEDVASANPVPQSWKNLCPAYDNWQKTNPIQDPSLSKRGTFGRYMPRSISN